MDPMQEERTASRAQSARDAFVIQMDSPGQPVKEVVELLDQPTVFKE